MNERIRTVRTGIVGLDLALGGGIRVARRTASLERESATLLIRGGPGAGKSILAQEIAIRTARSSGGDALYACVEILAAEVIAQRMGFEGYDPSAVVDLSGSDARRGDAPAGTLLLGTRDLAAGGQRPDLGRALLDLARAASERGYRPTTVVVDSLSDGYGLGKSVPRSVADALCRLAIEQGWVLILVEEAADESASPWTFALDTVLSLRVCSAASPGASRRELLVTKHRFGPCEAGPHRLSIEPERVAVVPPFSAYRHAARDLALPAPSSARSLAVAVDGASPPAGVFRVEDGEGRFVLLQGAGDDAEWLSGRIGRMAADGRPSSAAKVAFHLGERRLLPFRADHDGFETGTLDQLTDGEEWLEDALHRLSAWPGAVERVRCGPAEKLALYEHKADLQRAVWLFATMLANAGLVVLVFGAETEAIARVGTVTDRWQVRSLAPVAGTKRRLQITTTSPINSQFAVPVD